MLKLTNSWLIAAFIATIVGCGSSSETVQKSVDGDGSTSPATAGGPEADQAAASQIVSQFLDRVRRGSETAPAEELLTTTAQSELKRIGRRVEPMASHDATFRVTRCAPAPAVDGQPAGSSMLVQSIWSEPNGETGGITDFQVVWAVQRQPDGWRISGMVMQFSPDQPPTVIDFENGNQMAMMLGGADQEFQSGENPAEQVDTSRQAFQPSVQSLR